jgi:hypothetical protein
MDPQVVAAPLERIPKRIAGIFRFAFAPKFHPLGVVKLSLLDASWMGQLENLSLDTAQRETAGLPCPLGFLSATRGSNTSSAPAWRGPATSAVP